MNILTNISNFKWNLEWILSHKLDDKRLEKLDIGKQYNDEIFVQHPVYTDYYVSQYSRIISLKRDTETLIKQVPLNSEYLACTLCKDGSKYPMGIHRIVADVFCPNFWTDKNPDKVRLEVHHVDKNRCNNNYTNLVLLPQKLHADFEKIKRLCLLKDGKIIPYTNILDLVYDTGLSMEQIIYADRSKRRKPMKATGGYTVYNVRGFQIGYKYYPKKRKKKAARKQS